MNRLFLLLGLAAFGAGCGTNCPAPSLRVYWTPGASGPVAGFSVPGLAAAGFSPQLDCTAAGLDASAPIATSPRIEVRVNDVPVTCSYPDPCVGSDWQCSTGGVDIGAYPVVGGANKVEIFGYDGSGNLKYYGRDDIADACGFVVTGVVSDGQPGPLGIDYAFTDSAACQPGSSIDWDLRAGLATPFDTGSVACGGVNPFDVYGGANVPAGVYTLANVAEVVGATSYHAYCSAAPFVHAGPETVLVDMAPSNATCF